MKDLKHGPELRVSGKYKNVGYLYPDKSGQEAGLLRVILHINSWTASYLMCKIVILHFHSRLGREMGMTLTHAVNGRQLPLQHLHLHKNLEMVRSKPQGHACLD